MPLGGVAAGGYAASVTNTSADDSRSVPTPFGWCAECIREGVWLRAATLFNGTALCAQHVVYVAGAGEIDVPEGQDRSLSVLERLRAGINRSSKVAGF